MVESSVGDRVGGRLVVEPNVTVLHKSLQEKVAKSDLKEEMENDDIVLLLVDDKEFKRMDH